MAQKVTPQSSIDAGKIVPFFVMLNFEPSLSLTLFAAGLKIYVEWSRNFGVFGGHFEGLRADFQLGMLNTPPPKIELKFDLQFRPFCVSIRQLLVTIR